MSMNFPALVGAQIRTYRKASKLSLDDLAQRIHKSKATVCKYESGDISIDITTLYEIAEALNIEIGHLVEDIPIKATHLSNDLPFGFTEVFYLYHTHHSKYYTSQIHLGHQEGTNQYGATLYYRLKNDSQFHDCECIYNGHMQISSNNLHFVMKNFHSLAESIYISFFIPIKQVSYYPGLLMGIQNDNLRPACFKVLLAKHILSDQDLQAHLLLDREEIRGLKNGSYFAINE
ncbi:MULTISPECIES: helix-turn-helix domain-containing protein [Eubacterium]|uniref:Helix-turn-helix n=1 Tax=Eubacterium barkeri TaxID=1528 RepID=A0A1H3GIV9_EUBBA|nr:helix-turn-helix transcriptional regulator [Eubacterium barkeri]SDY03236.1 Helix-turn-helix [Eubacterium barkeri]